MHLIRPSYCVPVGAREPIPQRVRKAIAAVCIDMVSVAAGGEDYDIPFLYLDDASCASTVRLQEEILPKEMKSAAELPCKVQSCRTIKLRRISAVGTSRRSRACAS